jgi:WXG100 family type VII secretion target
MTKIDCFPEELQEFCDTLLESQAKMQGILEEIDTLVNAVEPKWQGDAQQVFQRFYRDWRKGVDAHSSALKKTAEQLMKMTEEYQKTM